MEIEVDLQGFGGEALREGEDCGEVVGLVIFLTGRRRKGLENLGVWICNVMHIRCREKVKGRSREGKGRKEMETYIQVVHQTVQSDLPIISIERYSCLRR